MVSGGERHLGAADGGAELTWSQFRALVRSQPARAGQIAEANRPRPEQVFLKLLSAQGRVAAARQSLDRFSGWTKAAQARLAAQSAPPLDVETLRFAEAKAQARLAQFEAGNRRAARAANRLIGREPDSPLAARPAAAQQSPDPATTEKPKLPEKTSDSARLRAQYEKELLTQAHDLLGKMYQNYLFGGVPLSALLWQEEQV